MDRLKIIEVTDAVGDSLLHSLYKNEKRDQAQIINILARLLDRGQDINVKNAAGKSILHMAIEDRYKDVIDFCLRRNADVGATDFNGNTFAHFAVQTEHRKFFDKNVNSVELEEEGSNFFDWLVSRRFDFFNVNNKRNQSALYLAVELNLQHVLLTLLKYVTDFPSLQKDRKPLLSYFFERKIYFLKPLNDSVQSTHQDRNIISIILEKDRSVTYEILNTAYCIATNNNESNELMGLLTAHFIRIQQNQMHADSPIRNFTYQYHQSVSIRKKIANGMQILKILVDNGASVNDSHDNQGTIAMMWFRYHAKFDILRQLKELGADFGVHANNGTGFLHLAGANSSEPGIIELLVSEGCNVNGIDGNGNSPLSLACIHGKTKIATTLIRFGADLKFKNNLGRCLFHLAANSPKTLELLVKKGANVNARDYEGQTPLHYTHEPKVIENIFKTGAFIDVLDGQGNTPLFCAISRKSLEIIQELLKYGADIRESKVFQCATDYFSIQDSMETESFRYLMEHLVKLAAVGLLQEIHHSHEGSEDKLQEFYQKCQKEVKFLKGYPVDICTSLYDVLHKNRNRRCAYADNEKLNSLVEDDVIVDKFPIYFIVIIGCYNEAKTRKLLLKEATSALKKIIKVSLPYLCVDQIFIYLSNMDLIRIIDTARDS